MNTDVEYLRQLELDLKDAAVREAAWREGSAGPAAPRPGHRWARVTGVAASFLVVAGVIGFVVEGGGFSGGGGETTGAFREVGGAGADGGGDRPAALPTPNAVTDTAGSAGYLPEDATGHGPAGVDPQADFRPQQDLSKIVRDGRIGVVVPDEGFGDAVGEVTFIAERNGGFILSSSTQNERSGTFVLRIPSRRFDRALAEIRELGDVRFQQITGDDVTAEFIDLRARLRILEQRRALLRGLLDGATTTEEILRISSQVDDVQLRIEQLEGQIRFINDQVAEATLRVSITERNAPNTEPRTSVQKPNLGSAVDLAVQGFLRIVGAVIVGLGYLVPLTILGAIVWFAVVLARRRREV